MILIFNRKTFPKTFQRNHSSQRFVNFLACFNMHARVSTIQESATTTVNSWSNSLTSNGLFNFIMPDINGIDFDLEVA